MSARLTPRRARGRRRAGLAGEAGFSVIEVVIAAMLVVLGSLATLAVVDAATRNTFRAEQSQVVNNRLQDELEKVKQLAYGEVALPTVPATSSDPTNPNSRVSGTTFNVGQQSGGAAQLVYNGSALEGEGTVSGGQVATGPQHFETGDVSGDIFRYVVWLNDATCAEQDCPGAQDFKRVIVAIRLDTSASAGARAYQELHTDIADPEVQPNPNSGPNEDPDPPPPGGDENTYPWTYWLTDTPCNNSTRQPIVADHPTHNTLGACSGQPQTGGTSGPPDLMFPEAPPLDSAFPPNQQPIRDYADDVEAATPIQNDDKGVQIIRPSASAPGCVVDLEQQTEKWKKIHKWVTPTVPANLSDLALTGKATLRLWTQTLNRASHSGKICIYLFRRQLNHLGVPIDTPLVNLDPPFLGLTYWEYEDATWPRCTRPAPQTCAQNGWEQIEVPLSFALDTNGGAIPMLPDTRLGLAIGVHRGGTGGEALQFLYDHPSFDSRLVVTANKLLQY